MEMGSKENIETITREGEVYMCPDCGYTDGFHVSFDMKKGPDKGEVVLICPACHARYRVGWSVKMD